MKFEIAVAAVLAAEKLASSGVDAGGGLSEVQERAVLRKEAIEAIAKEFPKSRRRLLGEGRPSRNLQERLTNASEEKLQKLKDAVKYQQQLKRRERSLGSSNTLDLGILPEKTVRNQGHKKKLLQTIQKLQSKKKETVNNLDRSRIESTTSDIKVVKSAESIRELMNALNPEQSSSSAGSLPDLGIFSKESENGNRRLEDVFSDFDPSQMVTAPLAFMVNTICTDTEASKYCDVCRVEYNDAANPGAGYSLYLDCDTPEGYEADTEYLTKNFNQLCDYALCKGGCKIDTDEFKVEMKDCSVTNVPGVSDELSDILPDDGGDLSDLADLYSNMNDVNDLLNSEQPLASTMEFLCGVLNIAYGDKLCNACGVTYLDPIQEITPYDITMDCPNLPDDLEQEDFDGSFEDFENLCSYGVCETCEFEENNLKLDLRNCSVAFLQYSIFDNIFDDNGDMADSGIADSYEETDDTVGNLGEYAEAALQYSFQEICGSEDAICGQSKCGPSPDSDSIVSFEFDCPALLSLGFGSYLSTASAFCAGQAQFGLECGTCDVNLFEATIKIDDCAILTAEEQAATVDVPPAMSDYFAFSALYEQSCRPDIYYYLQDTIDQPSCNCTFNARTKSASVSCQNKEVCQEFSSYCDDPLAMCDSYKVTASMTQNNPVSLQRCVDASFNIGDPIAFSDAGAYQFTYCLSYGVPEGVVNASEPSGVECEMNVQGVRCNSCSLEINETHAAYYGWDTNGVISAMSTGSRKMYNCDNTVIGATGNLSQFKLLDDTLAYYSYQSLPCLGGCDLCGDGKQFMSNPDAKFTAEMWKDNTEDTCFAAQLEAMTLKEPLSPEECKAVRDVVREPCGCKSSGTLSFGKGFSATSSIVLSIAAASIVQLLLG